MAGSGRSKSHPLQRDGSATIRTIELRRQIALEVNPLRKIMRIASGQRIIGLRRRPDADEILAANYKLLDKFLPDLKSVELSEDPDRPLRSKAEMVKEIMDILQADEPPKASRSKSKR